MNGLKDCKEKQSQEKQPQDFQVQEIEEFLVDELIALQSKSKTVQSFESFVNPDKLSTEALTEPETIVDPDPLLPPASVARMLGVTTQTLRAWHKEGKLNVVTTLGGHRRVHASEVARLMGKEFAPVRVTRNQEEEGF